MKRNNMLQSDMVRIFHNWRIYVAICAGLLLILHPLVKIWEYRNGFSPMQLLSAPLGSSDFTPFAAIFCVLPFAESFCEDQNSGYIYCIVERIGLKKYARKRCMSVALSGGIVTAVIMAVTILLCVIGAGQPETEETVSFMNNTIWAKMDIILLAHGMLLYLLRVFIAFLFGMLWALIGLCISVLIANRYVTLIAPFVLYQAMWFLLNETAINPVYLFRGDSNFIPSFAFLVIYQLTCIFLCAVFSIYGIKRRIRL